MSMSGAFAQGSRMAAWDEDRWYTEPDEEDEDYMSPEDIAERIVGSSAIPSSSSAVS